MLRLGDGRLEGWGELEWDCCYTDLPELSELQRPRSLGVEVLSPCSCPLKALTVPQLIRSLALVPRDLGQSSLPPALCAAHAAGS